MPEAIQAATHPSGESFGRNEDTIKSFYDI